MRITDYLSDPDMRAMTLDALAAGAGVVVMCSLLSPLVVVKRLGFVGQGVSHAAFGGIGVAAILGALGLISPGSPMEVAVIAAFCILSAVVIAGLSNRRAVPEDTAIGIVLVGSMALGAILVQAAPRIAAAEGLTYAPRSWESILFGSLLAAGGAEAATSLILAAIVVAAVALLRRPMLFFAFDEDSARAFGVPTRVLRVSLMVLLALAVVSATRVAGVVLATALLVFPGAVALRVTDRLRTALAVSLGAGLVSLVAGVALAIELDWQAGPSVVLILAALLLGATVIGRLRERLSTRADAGPAAGRAA